MKAENMKERKREEKERKEKDPVWLIFQRPDVGRRQPESCKIRALDVHESKDREVSLIKKAVCEKLSEPYGSILRYDIRPSPPSGASAPSIAAAVDHP